jgi:hypothetical protein
MVMASFEMKNVAQGGRCVPGAARNRTDTSICNPPAPYRAFSRDDEAATRSVEGGGNRNTSARGPVCSRLVFAARSPDGVGTIANASGAAIALYLRNQQRSDRYLLSWAFAWIADLGTAEKTVKVHRARGLEKMQVRSLAELVRAVERLRGAQPVPVGTPDFRQGNRQARSAGLLQEFR